MNLVAVEKLLVKSGSIENFLKRLSSALGETFTKANWKTRLTAIAKSKPGIAAMVLSAASGAGLVIDDVYDYLAAGADADSQAGLEAVKSRLISLADHFSADGDPDKVRGFVESDFQRANAMIAESDSIVRTLIGEAGSLQAAFDLFVARENAEVVDFIAYGERHGIRLDTGKISNA
jgi:hypothetical protein